MMKECRRREEKRMKTFGPKVAETDTEDVLKDFNKNLCR